MEVQEESSAASQVESNESFEEEYWDLALNGMLLLINNDWKSADELFNKHKEYSPLMLYGSCIACFMQALMSFEDEKLEEAMKCLKHTEEQCQTSTHVFKSIKRKLKHKRRTQSQAEIEDKYHKKIIEADCILYQAILCTTNQDLKSYVKAGWLLRKAWKLYEHAHNDIEKMYEQQKTLEESATGSANSTDTNRLPLDALCRLRGAVNFGYGGLQLSISLVPPKVLKIIEFLGFDGDREGGLRSLGIASNSKDMRAPIATLALLWYHTVVRPFFALDGNHIDAGVKDALAIYEHSCVQYPDSALFKYFYARILRLQGKLAECLNSYSQSLGNSKNQREIQLICLHEMGWVYMMRLDHSAAVQCFMQLKTESRWSKSYYSYLVAINLGADGDIQESRSNFTEVPALIRRKNNQIEKFVLRRTEDFHTLNSKSVCRMLCYEVLFLWNSLPCDPEAQLTSMIDHCDSTPETDLRHLCCLVKGALYGRLKNDEKAIQSYRECIAEQRGMKDDKHVAAYAMYELGAILIQKPKSFSEGKQYLHDAKDKYKDFDFDNRLSVKVTARLKRLNTEGTAV